MVTEFHGLVKNFPRAARLKRSGNALDEEEAEEREPLAVQDQPQDQAEEVVVVRAIRPHRTAGRKEKTAAVERQQAYEGTQDAYDEAAALDDWEREEARRAEAMGAPAARHSKKAATTKKQKRSTNVTLRKALADDGSSAADSAAFVTPARRTTRSSSAKKSKGKQQPDMIREDVEEHHTTGDFSAGLARGQDDLVSLLNGLEGCEIRSDLGSGECIKRRIRSWAVLTCTRNRVHSDPVKGRLHRFHARRLRFASNHSLDRTDPKRGHTIHDSITQA